MIRAIFFLEEYNILKEKEKKRGGRHTRTMK